MENDCRLQIGERAFAVRQLADVEMGEPRLAEHDIGRVDMLVIGGKQLVDGVAEHAAAPGDQHAIMAIHGPPEEAVGPLMRGSAVAKGHQLRRGHEPTGNTRI